MTKASKARIRKKSEAKGEVVPIKPKKGLKLTEDELVRLENFQLKVQALQDKVVAPVIAKQSALVQKVNKRLGVDISAYTVNWETGVLTPQGQQAENPAHAKAKKSG